MFTPQFLADERLFWDGLRDIETRQNEDVFRMLPEERFDEDGPQRGGRPIVDDEHPTED
jgi:hypothetical protein